MTHTRDRCTLCCVHAVCTRADSVIGLVYPAMSDALTADPASVLGRSVASPSPGARTTQNVEEFYDLDGVQGFVEKGEYKKVCDSFADS
jgi:hypothetical protein